MTIGVIGYDNPGEDGFPSPAVWGDCPTTQLLDRDQGYFVDARGIGNVNSLPDLRTDSDSQTITYNDGTQDFRAVDVTTGSTDNNAVALHTSPLATVVQGSGVKLWAEVDVTLAALTDQALFFGLAENAALDRDVVADDPSNSAQAGLDTESMIGFVTQQNSSATNKLDAVYRKDNGSVVTVLADVTNATAFDTAPGDLTANEFVRLGVVFNGRDTLRFYVNGVKVAEQTVDSTVDQSKEYGAILALKTGAGSARTMRYRFFRAAAQFRS